MFLNTEMLQDSYFSNGDRATGVVSRDDDGVLIYQAISSSTGQVYETETTPVHVSRLRVLKFGNGWAKPEFEIAN